LAVPPEIVDDVRSRADILSVIGDYVSLRKRGRNWVGLCPFHSEKTPSFTVSPEKAMFYCFGCNAGGNVFTFLMQIENMTFQEALRNLASRYGVTIPERPLTPADKQRRQKKENVAEVIEAAARFYTDLLLKQQEGEEGRSYLASRDFDNNVARQFRLGWSPRSWDTLLGHLKGKGFSPEDAEDAGLAVKRTGGGHYDKFRGRIMFPILSVQGRVLGFGGRVIKDDEEPKYMNSPETAIYRKSAVLYGLHAASDAIRKQDAAIIVEGYFDCLALYKHGFFNAIATCGTALTVEHVRMLSRYTKNLYPLFDADEAGRKAARRALEVILAASARAFSVALPSGDPDSFLAEEGPEKMAELLEDAPPLLKVTLEEIIAGAGSNVETRQEALKKAAALLAVMADRQAMDLYIRDSAARIIPGTGADAEQLLREEIARTRKFQARAQASTETKKETKKILVTSPELHLLALCLDNEEALDMLRSKPEVVDDFEEASLREAARELFAKPDAASVIDSLAPEIAAALSGITIDRAGREDEESEAEFDELARRVQMKKIARMKKDIQTKLATVEPHEQIELLKRKSELLEMERSLEKGSKFFPDEATQQSGE